MNQLEKTEVITCLITNVKSKISSRVFKLKRNSLEFPNFLEEEQKIKNLDILLREFYEKKEVNDEDYLYFLNEIKKYGEF